MVDFDWGSIFEFIIGDDEDVPQEISAELMARLLGNILENNEGLTDDQRSAIEAQIEELIGDPDELPPEIVERVDRELQELIDNSESRLGNIVDGIGEALGDSLTDFTDEIDELARGVITNIGDESTGAIDILQDIGGSILGDIGISVDGVLDSVSDVAQRVLEIIGTDARGAIEAVRKVADSVDETTTGILNVVADNVNETFESIDTSVARETEAATRALEESTEQIGQLGDAQVAAAEEQAEAIRTGIADSLDALTDDTEGALGQVAAAQDAQVLATSEQTSVIQAGFGNVAETIGGAIKAGAGFIPGFDAVAGLFDEDTLYAQFRQTLINTGVPEEQADELVSIVRDQTAGTPVPVLFLILQLISISYTAGFFQEMSRVVMNPSLQQMARAVPSALPAIGEILELRNRDLLDDQLAVELLRLQGFSEALAGGLLAARTRLPDVGVIQTWYLRKFLSGDATQTKLEQLGFSEADAQRFIDMSFYIPPPQDIILWAVREVFNVDQAQRFGQFDEFPDDFADLAAEQGISRNFAQNYWAAHWRMPSLSRLFEMYHRKIIDEDTLRLTIKSHDFTPFWREPLINVAYRPLTRVDIRRMHDLGLLSEQQVQARYEELGFSPDDAGLMTQFTLEFNAEPAAESPETIEQVARDATLNMFRDGIFLEDETLERLIELGLPEPEARIFLDAEILERERQDRKAQRDLVVEQAKAGALTFEEAFDRLGGLGFEPEELNRAVTEIHRARAAATKLPTRQELDDMLANELIRGDEYIDALQRIGYAPFWAQRFLALQRGKPQ